MTLPIFPNLKSIGNGAKSKKEAKANAIIAFLAQMEKRKQVGLFVPYIVRISNEFNGKINENLEFRFRVYFVIFKLNYVERLFRQLVK